MSASEKLFLCPVLPIQEDFIIFFQIMPDAKARYGQCETRQNLVKMYRCGVVFFICYLQFSDVVQDNK